MNKIYVKTQTKRSIQFKENIENINIGVNYNHKDFEFGIVTSKYWGDFRERKEPIITLEIEGKHTHYPISQVIAKLKELVEDEK